VRTEFSRLSWRDSGYEGCAGLFCAGMRVNAERHRAVTGIQISTLIFSGRSMGTSGFDAS